MKTHMLGLVGLPMSRCRPVLEIQPMPLMMQRTNAIDSFSGRSGPRPTTASSEDPTGWPGSYTAAIWDQPHGPRGSWPTR